MVVGEYPEIRLDPDGRTVPDDDLVVTVAVDVPRVDALGEIAQVGADELKAIVPRQGIVFPDHQAVVVPPADDLIAAQPADIVSCDIGEVVCVTDPGVIQPQEGEPLP